MEVGSVKRYVMTSSLINQERTKKIGQAAWLSRSLRSRVYDHLSREIPFVLKSIDAVPFREAVADPNRRWYTFDTLKRNEWSVMWGPGCKTFLLNPLYSSLEIHYRQVVPYLVIVGIQSPISACGFDCILYMWSVRCKRSARFYLLVIRHYYNIRRRYWCQSVLGYSKVKKNVRVYVWTSLSIILLFQKG